MPEAIEPELPIPAKAPRREYMPNAIMQFFAYAHLPAPLREVSAPICHLAERMQANLPDGPEKSAGLRKLLEAKDCFVRAAL